MKALKRWFKWRFISTWKFLYEIDTAFGMPKSQKVTKSHFLIKIDEKDGKSPFSLFLNGLSVWPGHKMRKLKISGRRKSGLFIGNLCISLIIDVLMRQWKYAFHTGISILFIVSEAVVVVGWPRRNSGNPCIRATRGKWKKVKKWKC